MVSFKIPTLFFLMSTTWIIHIFSSGKNLLNTSVLFISLLIHSANFVKLFEYLKLEVEYIFVSYAFTKISVAGYSIGYHQLWALISFTDQLGTQTYIFMSP